MSSVLDQIRAQGFTLKPVHDGLYVEPIDELTEAQRQWLIAHKPLLIAELRSEAANEPANVDQDSRWDWFVSLAMDHGVTANEVAGQFNDDDITDLLGEPDNSLPLHAKTIADAIKRGRSTAEALLVVQTAGGDTPEPLKAIQPVTVRQTCGACQHFARIDHPHLGHCRIQAQPEAPCGLWDTDRRNYCYAWQVVAL